jgi:V/A-type H+-transporting ATPase subunit B
MGTEGLSEIDRTFLTFGERFEHEIVQQNHARTLEESMQVGWEILRELPVTELSRLSDEQIARYITEKVKDHAG